MKGILVSLTLHFLVLTLSLGQPKPVLLKVENSEASHVFSVTLQVNEEEIKVIKKKVTRALKKKSLKKLKPKPVLTPKKISDVMRSKTKANQGKLKNDYLSELRRFIESKKFYPRMAARLKHSGVVEIALVLDEDGNFKDIKIKRASSFETLNDAAIDLVRSLKKFKPIPGDMKQNNLAVNIPLNYSL